jgi:hypothetical protein
VAPTTRTTRYYYYSTTKMPGIQNAAAQPLDFQTKTVTPKESSSTMDSAPPSPKGRGVNFHDSPVSSELRPISNREGWALHFFEDHARKCADCHDPYGRHLNHEHLCDEGHQLAQGVARMLYAMKDGRIYSHPRRSSKDGDDEESYRLVRVEVPNGYTECLGLLRAIERSIRHRRRTPFVSFDRSYPIAPRVLQEPAVPKARGRKEKEYHSSRRYAAEEEVAVPAATQATRRYRVRDASPAVLTVEASPSRAHQHRRRSSTSKNRSKRSSIEIVSWPTESSSSTEDTEDESLREREEHERAYELRNQQRQRSRHDSFTNTPAILAAPQPQPQQVLDVNINKRGSLYAADEKERKRESRRYYNVEVREPKFAKEAGLDSRRRKTLYHS